MAPRIRVASRKDIPALAQIAQAGFESSPVYSFVRVRARQYRHHVLQSYHRELTTLMSDSQNHVMVIEKRKSDQLAHIQEKLETNRHSGASFMDLKWFIFCGSLGQSSTEHPAGSETGDNIEVPEIVGYVVWRESARPKPVAMDGRRRRKVTSFLNSIKSNIEHILHTQDTCCRRARLLSGALQKSHQNLFSLSLGQPPRIEVVQIVVQPRYQRLGYGTLLMGEVLNAAREKGVGIWVFSTPIGERLYKKVGFQTIDEVVVKGQECRRTANGGARVQAKLTEKPLEAGVDRHAQTEAEYECRLGVMVWWPQMINEFSEEVGGEKLSLGRS